MSVNDNISVIDHGNSNVDSMELTQIMTYETYRIL